MNDKISEEKAGNLSGELLQELLNEAQDCKNNTNKLFDLTGRIMGHEPVEKDESDKMTEPKSFVEKLKIVIDSLRNSNKIASQSLEKLQKFI